MSNGPGTGATARIDLTGRIEPVPRRVRAMLAGRTIVDTTTALYVWEWPYYPQFHIPLADVAEGSLVDEDSGRETPRGAARRHGVRAGDIHRIDAANVFGADAVAGVVHTVRFDWDACDAWFEEDEEVFVHPRNPYTRVDALRSSRPVRVELEDVVLAESSATVMVFETGLPTRYYFDRTSVDFTHLTLSDTVTPCPYKGRTTGYWSARVGDTTVDDVAWAYDFPTRQLLPIAGMVAFYNESVDLFVDGTPVPRAVTHMR